MIVSRIPWDRSLLKRAGIVASGGIAFALVLAFLNQWQDRLGQNEARVQDEIGRTEALLDQAPAWREALAGLEATPITQEASIAAANDSLAAARLQTHVVDIIRKAGGDLRSVQSLPVDREGDRALLGLEVDFTVDSKGLVNVLESLETSLPILLLSKSSIRGVPRFGQTGDTHPVDIHVQTQIQAFLEEPS